MIGLAPGTDVQVGVVAQHAGGLHRVALIVLRELLHPVVGLLIYQIALFNPTFDPARGAHPRETLFMIKNFHALPVLDGAILVVDRRDLVAKRGLRCRHISHLQHAMAASAGYKHGCGSKHAS